MYVDVMDNAENLVAECMNRASQFLDKAGNRKKGDVIELARMLLKAYELFDNIEVNENVPTLRRMEKA